MKVYFLEFTYIIYPETNPKKFMRIFNNRFKLLQNRIEDMKYIILGLLDLLSILSVFLFCQFYMFGAVQVDLKIIIVAFVFGALALRKLQIYKYIVSESDLTFLFFRMTGGILFINLILVQGIDNGIPVFLSATPMASMLLIFYREIANKRFRNSTEKREKIAVYGAGEAGSMLAASLSKSKRYDISFFIDDNVSLVGRAVRQIPVTSIKALRENLSKFDVNQIVIAMPSLSQQERKHILNRLALYSVSITTLPPLEDIVLDKRNLESFTDVSIEDLLGRAAVKPDRFLLGKVVKDGVILVTGAGGSIGGEICKQLVKLNPKKIVLLDTSELGLYQIERELSKYSLCCDLVMQIGSICDSDLLEVLYRDHPITVIFHAAAYKHVPMMERNIAQAVKNNVFGTLNLVRFAERFHINRFVLVSTDKAVRPTNVMGATKRFCEMILQARASMAEPMKDPIYSMVRFGNVLGSSGSVVPLFREQIDLGGPITLTSPEITRYFMSLSEAAELVIQSASLANSGDLFVLDMGEPIRILELAKAMIRLSGRTIKDGQHPNGDIEIQITGLRPGEKLYEELLIGDNVIPTSHRKILRAKEEFLDWEHLKVILDQLLVAQEANDQEAMLEILSSHIQGFGTRVVR